MVALRGLLRYVRELRASGGGQELGGVHHWLGLGLCESNRCILLERGLHQVRCAVEGRFGLPEAATAAARRLARIHCRDDCYLRARRIL